MISLPSSFEEFETTVERALTELWGTSAIVRHGQEGAARFGVHLTGPDKELGGRTAGALLVMADKPLATREIKDVVAKADLYTPPLALLLVVLPIATDTLSQEQFRRVSTAHHQRALFHVKPWFWDELTATPPRAPGSQWQGT